MLVGLGLKKDALSAAKSLDALQSQLKWYKLAQDRLVVASFDTVGGCMYLACIMFPLAAT